jgi:glycosyltransferase involved in cell wall biosynthesis
MAEKQFLVMNIAINAISVKTGGSALVLRKLLEKFVVLRDDCEYYVIVNSSLLDCPCAEHPRIHIYTFPWMEKNFLLTGFWYLAVLPRWLKRRSIDILFSQTNYLPSIATVPCALLVQHAGYFCNEFHLEGNLTWPERISWSIKKRWILRSVRMADRVTVQTQALADRLYASCPSLTTRIRVIPHGPGFVEGALPFRPSRFATGAHLEIAYVTKHGKQKNFLVLFRALRILRDRSVRTRLHLTLTKNAVPTDAVVRQAIAAGVEDDVVNHGELDYESLSNLYRGMHLFVFPSVCESFGFPLVEAMAFGLPIVAADTASNREILGDVASYFSFDDAKCLASIIEGLYKRPEELQAASLLSATRAAAFDWTKSARETMEWLTEEENTITGGVGGGGRTEVGAR